MPDVLVNSLMPPSKVTQVVPGLINWNPGFSLLSYSPAIQTGQTYPGSLYASEIAAAAASRPTINGYACFITWGLLEDATQGSYTQVANNGTSFFAQLMTACTNNNLHVSFQFTPGNFTAGGGWAPQGPGEIPDYILTGASFGAYNSGGYSFPGGQGPLPPYLYGWYETEDGSYYANFVGNTNVYSAMLTAIRNFAQQWDGNPYLEAFIFIDDDNVEPYSGTGLQGDSYYALYASMMLTIKSYFTHTNVGCQVNGAQTTEGQQYLQAMVQGGVLVSCSDTGGATMWLDTFSGPSYANRGYTFTASPQLGNTTATVSGGIGVWSDAWPGNTYSCVLSNGQTVAMAQSNSGPGTAVSFSPAVSSNCPNSSFTINFAPPQLGPAFQAWLGIQSPGSSWAPPSPPLQTYYTSMMFMEEGDLWDTLLPPPLFWGVTLPDAVNACNDAVTGGVGYHCSHLFVSYGNATVWSARLTALQSLSLLNTGYPPVYV